MVTLFAVWLGWELKVVKKRKGFEREDATLAIAWRSTLLASDPSSLFTKSIPSWRHVFGDEAAVFVHCRTESHAREARRMFPEAAILFWDDDDKMNIWFDFATLNEMIECRTLLVLCHSNELGLVVCV